MSVGGCSCLRGGCSWLSRAVSSPSCVGECPCVNVVTSWRVGLLVLAPPFNPPRHDSESLWYCRRGGKRRVSV